MPGVLTRRNAGHLQRLIRHKTAAGWSLAARRAARVIGGAAKRWLGKRKRQQQLGHESKKVKKTHPDSVHVDSLHSGYSADTIRVKRSGIKRVPKSKVLGRFMQQQNHSGGFVTSEGQQGLGDFCSVFSISQILDNTPAYNVNQAAVGLMDLNPYRKTTGSTFFSGTAVQPLDDEIFLRGAEIKLTVTNQSNMGMHVDWYLVTPRKYVGVTALSSMVYGLGDESLGATPMTFPAAGTGGYGTAGAEQASNVGAKPQDFQRFREMWKICAVRTQRLEGGSSEDVNFDIKVDKVVKESVLKQQQTNGMFYIPGVSYQLFCIVRGTVVLDDTVGATPTNTFGSAKIGYIAVTRSTANSVAGGGARISTNIGVSQLVTGGAAAAQKVISSVDTNMEATYAA